jgi:type VI secretion system secreted protein VgrG
MANFLDDLYRLLADRQQNRILRLSFPNDDGPSSLLLVNAIDAVESVSRDFEFTVQLLSDDPALALKDMQGKLLSVELVRGDGSLRHFTGYVFSFACKRSDGGITFYEAKLGPWLRFLSLRMDNYLFHGMTLREQTDDVFNDYATLANWDWRVAGDDPAWTDACQFDETDFNYLSRRWEAAGYMYWYEHTAAGHQLIVSDDSTLAPPVDGGGSIRFQRHGGIREEDAIDTWSPVRSIIPGHAALTGFDFKVPGTHKAAVPTIAEQGDVPSLESYEYAGAYGFADWNDGDRLARLRMSEFEARAKYYETQGNSRWCMPGRSLQLTDHFRHDAAFDDGRHGSDRFLILTVQHTATNNYLHPQGEQPHYRNRMTCSRLDVPWHPGRGFNSRDTRILTPQSATIVGPTGPDTLYTDEYGRVRVQFHWDRAGSFDERSSAWVRVASSWAGAELGGMALPRVGSEVLVQWLDGNPDRPIITGSVFNAQYMPPWELPAQQALSGLRSRELAPDSGNAAGGRSNHLILDDTHNALQAQLKSDYGCSQLSLGRITRIEDARGRRDARGEGWEIATDAWGVARAGKGLLITTEARPNAAGAAKNMAETTARLGAAYDEQAAQAKAAEQYGAQEKTVLQADAAQAVKAQNDAIRGADAGAEFPELSEPNLVLSGAAGIALTSGRSTHVASTEHTSLTSGKSLSIAAGTSLFASVRESLRLFVQRAGMKLIAAAGDIDVKALSDSVNILAKLNITHTADKILISAREEVQINGGGSYIKFTKGGIEQGTSGSNVSHAAKHSVVGPQNLDVVQQKAFEEGVPRKYSQQVVVDPALWNLPDGLRQVSYKFVSEANTVLGAGKLDGEGKSARLFTDVAHATSVVIDVNEGKWEQLIAERYEGIDSAISAAQIVFDYPEHDDERLAEADTDAGEESNDAEDTTV